MRAALVFVALRTFADVGVAFAWKTPEPAAPKPLLAFEKTVIDLGEVVAGDTPKASFRFRNATKSNVRITHVTPACRCSVVESAPESVVPGERAKIAVALHTEGLRGGVQKKFVVYHTDGELGRHQVLNIIARIVPRGELAIEPDSMSLGDVFADEEISRTFRIISRGARGPRALAVEAPDWLKYELLETPGGGQELRVSGRLPRQSQQVGSKMVIVSNDKQNPRHEVPIQGSVHGSLKSEPASVVVLGASCGASARRFVIRDTSGQGVTKASAEIDAAEKGAAVTVEQVESDGVTLVLQPDDDALAKREFLEGAIVVTMRVGDREERIRVPYLIVAAEKGGPATP